MVDQDARVGSDELQFDRVVTESPSSTAPSELAVTCAACQASIETEYFDVNGSVVCSRCRGIVESAAETPRGLVPLLTAGVFGLGAGVVGAAIYYAVIAIANLEIGIVAILIGYMVGYSVRKGARGRGGLRFQVLAVALTYASIALAYTPILVMQARAASRAEKASAATGSNSSGPANTRSSGAATTKPGGGSFIVAVVILGAIVASLPVMVVVGSFPSGLISAFIIFIGMKQAWRMTGAPALLILGPYRVGAAPAPTPA
jgi:hypothetical protein